ncbi:30S ribosomal protein S16 [Anatilimnocola sp. NA78]|uniref:30S ribosomal protein S16 n=1 Tax=Anatilimnocola sp. NA78 TaxID=3415683 RepID=UPI003CE460A3
MAVRIRMKKLGRKHRPYFRICAIESRNPRDGKVLEELGSYDPMVKETDARALLKGERINYWISVGALPSDNVRVLIKKYGANGSHLAQQQAALERLKISRPTAPAPWTPPPKAEPEAPAAEAAPAEGEAPAKSAG